MKLRNKKTNKIVDFNYLQTDYISPLLLTVSTNGGPEMFNYYSLAEINEEWEDAPEEPKEYYCIDWTEPGIYRTAYEDERDDFNKEIGNYFDTREEAEKAVEKLKAAKRLKDKGVSFELKLIGRKQYLEPKANPSHRTFDEAHDIYKDVMIVFGGEE